MSTTEDNSDVLSHTNADCFWQGCLTFISSYNPLNATACNPSQPDGSFLVADADENA